MPNFRLSGAALYGIMFLSCHKWNRPLSGEILSLLPKPHLPHRHLLLKSPFAPTVLSLRAHEGYCKPAKVPLPQTSTALLYQKEDDRKQGALSNSSLPPKSALPPSWLRYSGDSCITKQRRPLADSEIRKSDGHFASSGLCAPSVLSVLP